MAETAMGLTLAALSPAVGAALAVAATGRGVRGVTRVARRPRIRRRLALCAGVMATLATVVGVEAAAQPTPLGALAAAGLGWTLLLLAAIDCRTFRLPDALTLPLAAAGVAVALAGLGDPTARIVGAAAGYAVMWSVSEGFRLATGRDGLGLGDAKLFAAAGAWVGWQDLPSVLLVAALAGLAQLLGRAVHSGASLREAAPFGPALALATWVVWAHGPLTG